MGKVVHFEIPADDVERAQKFYSNVFKWDIDPMPEMKYTIVRTGPVDENRMAKEVGFINGGMMKRSNSLKNPIITIQVDDIEQSLREVEKEGGKIVEKTIKVGDMGLAAYFQDTEGNILGLWQNLK